VRVNNILGTNADRRVNDVIQENIRTIVWNLRITKKFGVYIQCFGKPSTWICPKHKSKRTV